MNSLISFNNLQEWFGYERRSDIIRKLKDEGISYTLGKDGNPITTIEAINKSLLGTVQDDEKTGWEIA
ncbi:hypothetical protein [Thiomicrorhabdus sp.]|uniref:hypothetical protein n=1 Tax=Thiomicrorhabdus sp. TaxID=2039724 RepID=UPI0029C7EBFA|nr:hypothetical protein [Thiomicrorhabdus sp.]